MELKLILEAILFSAQKPLSLKEMRDVFAAAADHAEGDETAAPLKKIKEDELIAALEELARDHEAAQRSYRLACVAGAWQFVTQPEYAPWLKALVGQRPARPGSPSRRWRRWPSSPTASPLPAPRSNRCAAWPWTASCKRSSNAAWSSKSGARRSLAAR